MWIRAAGAFGALLFLTSAAVADCKNLDGVYVGTCQIKATTFADDNRKLTLFIGQKGCGEFDVRQDDERYYKYSESGTLEDAPSYASYRKAVLDPSSGTLTLHETFMGKTGGTVLTHSSRIRPIGNGTLSFDFEEFSVDQGKQFELINCPSLKKDEQCPYTKELDENVAQQTGLKQELAALKEACSADGLVTMRKLYAVYRAHNLAEEKALEDKRCVVKGDHAANVKTTENTTAEIEKCEAAVKGGANYAVLRCETFDKSKPPKQILESTFTVDKVGKRYKLVDKPTKDFDPEDLYEPADGSEWYDATVDGEVIWWEDEVSHFELDLSSGVGSYLGMDAVLDYKCKK